MQSKPAEFRLYETPKKTDLEISIDFETREGIRSADSDFHMNLSFARRWQMRCGTILPRVVMLFVTENAPLKVINFKTFHLLNPTRPSLALNFHIFHPRPTFSIAREN
jgi:hypothetical protein